MASNRILVLDDDESIADFVGDALRSAGFDMTVTHVPSEALKEAAGSKFDLFISDVNMPQMHGFEFRKRIRLLGPYTATPFLFMSSADRQIEHEIARSLGTDRLLIKPFPPGELRRQVAGLLRLVRTERGSIPEAFDRILHEIVERQESGMLTIATGTVRKRIVFKSGSIVFSASNDPRDLIGQALLRTGWIGEKDLLAAFATGSGEAAQPGIATALQAMRKLTPEQCQQVFEGKIRESVLEVFLWKSGMADYFAGEVEAGEAPFPLELDLRAVRIEGLRRRQKWAEVLESIPDPTVRFERVKPKWPEGFPKTGGDRVLAQHVERGLTFAEMLVELRGQDYAVGVRIASLVKAGVLRVGEQAGYAALLPDEFESVNIEGESLEILGAPVDAAPLSPFDILVEDPKSEVGTGTIELLTPKDRPPHKPIELTTDEHRFMEGITRKSTPPQVPAPAPPAPIAAPAKPMSSWTALVPGAPTNTPAPLPWPAPTNVPTTVTPAPLPELFPDEPIAPFELDGLDGAPPRAPIAPFGLDGAPPRAPIALEFVPAPALQPIMTPAPPDALTRATVPQLQQEEPRPPAPFTQPQIPFRMPAATAATVPLPWANVPMTPPPVTKSQTPPGVAALTKGLDLLRAGAADSARASFVEVLIHDPLNALAIQRIKDCDAAIADAARKNGLTNEQAVALAIPISRLTGMQIPPHDAFVLTRLAAGGMTIGDLLLLCPMTELEILSVVQRFLSAGILAKTE